MKFIVFYFSFLVTVFISPSRHAVLGTKKSVNKAASSILSSCPKSQCLTDAISCLANAGGTSQDDSHAQKLANLEKEVAALKAQLANAGKPSGFALLDSNGRLPQKLLAAGYDKHSLYDLGWQSLHVAAAAACRGSTSSGGTGCCGNVVLARNTADKKTCAQICAQTRYRNCDGEVSIKGKTGKATQNGEKVGLFYNYGCNHSGNGGNEASNPVTDITRFPGQSYYDSFCCCRK